MTTSVRVTIVSEEGEVLDNFIVSGPMTVENGSDRDQQVALGKIVRESIEHDPNFYDVMDAP